MGTATNACQHKNRIAGVARPQALHGDRDPRRHLAVRRQQDRPGVLARRSDTPPASATARASRSIVRAALLSTQHGRDQLHSNWPELYKPEQEATLPAEELLHAAARAATTAGPVLLRCGQNKLVLAPEYGGDGGKAWGHAPTRGAGGGVPGALGAERPGALRARANSRLIIDTARSSPSMAPGIARPCPQGGYKQYALFLSSTGSVGVCSLVGQRPSPWFNVLAGVVVVTGIIYAGVHLADDLSVVRDTRAYPFVLLGIALFIALGFEFVNGFHDTANAVATVIYTHSLPPNFAVVWSGTFNFLGVLVSSGAVAFGIVSLLPVELILQVGSGAGFAMVFALLLAAILWNLGTWYFGLPSSSSHTLIGSIMGVGLMNQLMAGNTGTSGVDWSQAAKIGESLLFSPLIGFSLAALLLLVAKALIPSPALFHEPKDNRAAAAAHSGVARAHVHGRELCAWLERRAERHGSHHADPHRYRADGVCSQPHHA